MSIQVIGGPDSPEVLEQLRIHEQEHEGNVARAVVGNPPLGLAKYGVTLRTPGLMHGAMIARVMAAAKDEISSYDQMFIYLFTLGAPLEKVYASLYLAEKQGLPAFMATTYEWFESLGLPKGITQEVLDAVTESFTLAQALAPKETKDAEGVVTIKKKETLGSSSPLIESPPSTDGTKITSGGTSPSPVSPPTSPQS